MPSTSIYRNCLDTKKGLRYRDFFSKFKDFDVGDILEEVNDTPFDCIDSAENMTIKFKLHEGLKLIFMLSSFTSLHHHTVICDRLYVVYAPILILHVYIVNLPPPTI